MKLKLLNDNCMPLRVDEQSAGWDVRANIENKIVIMPYERKMIPTGIIIHELDEGKYGRLAPRSGLALRNGIQVMAGVIDRSYRDEIRIILYNTSNEGFIVEPYMRIGQLIIELYSSENITIIEDDVELSNTNRGTDGFGSSGTN